MSLRANIYLPMPMKQSNHSVVWKAFSITVT